jgi:hypothetical protein
MAYAESKKDAPLYEECYNAFEGKYGKEPRAKQALAGMKKKLEEMKASGEKKDDDKKDEKKEDDGMGGK